MHTPVGKDCGSENGVHTVSAALSVVAPRGNSTLPRSPVFSRSNTSAGMYAVVLFVVKVSVIIVNYVFLLVGVCSLYVSSTCTNVSCLCLYFNQSD